MTVNAELIRRINRLPPQYVGKVFDFVDYLQQKAENQNEDEIAAYQAMAADTEREQEASEWCNSYLQ